ncbi:hypothetical protein ACWGRK_06860 [Saccharomonospora azurea]
MRLLSAARVDSITALGWTGGYAYLTRRERPTVARLPLPILGLDDAERAHVAWLVDALGVDS